MASYYYLVPKLTNVPFKDYKGKSVRLSPKVPVFVDEVVLALKGDSSKIKKITTYKNIKGEIIERSFDYFDKPVKNRLYNSLGKKIRQDESVISSKEIKEFELLRKFLKKFTKRNTPQKMSLWSPVQILTHHVCFDKKVGLVHSMAKIDNIAKGRETHTIIEFPHKSYGHNYKTFKKLISFDVDTHDYKILWNTRRTKNAKMPKKDSFLGFRILPVRDFVRAVTKKFINDHGHGIERAGIRINFCIPPANQRDIISGHFDPVSGAVEFNKLQNCMKSKILMVRNSAHEAEHAWQYFLHARNGGAVYKWEYKIARQFGDLENNPRLKQEADSYFSAIEDYVPIEKDRKAYYDNYIEKCARDTGDKAQERYIDEGSELHRQFPYIPKELL